MHKNWHCPDDQPGDAPYPFPIPGSDEEFPHCPVYSLRTADQGLPAEHLIEGTIHPAHHVSEWAMEVEAGSRSVESLSPKARDLVHVWLREKQKREEYDRKKREEQRRARA